MDKIMIRKSITINAPPQKIWTILTEIDFIKQWASAFYEGTYVETTWEPGTALVWLTPGGEIGAKGKVAVFDPPFHIKADYFDDVNSSMDAPVGEYSEKFYVEENEKESRLRVEAGPLAPEYKTQEPLWENALQRIKDLCEQETTAG